MTSRSALNVWAFFWRSWSGRKFVSAAKFVEKERRHMAGRKDATTASNRVTSHLKFYPFTLFGKNFINLKKYETQVEFCTVGNYFYFFYKLSIVSNNKWFIIIMIRQINKLLFVTSQSDNIKSGKKLKIYLRPILKTFLVSLKKVLPSEILLSLQNYNSVLRLYCKASKAKELKERNIVMQPLKLP